MQLAFKPTRYKCVFCGWTDALKSEEPPKCCNGWQMAPVDPNQFQPIPKEPK